MARSAPLLKPSGSNSAPLIVISQQAYRALHHQIDALARVRTIADNIAQAIHFRDALLTNISAPLEGFEVAMDVADQCTLHKAAHFTPRGTGSSAYAGGEAVASFKARTLGNI